MSDRDARCEEASSERLPRCACASVTTTIGIIAMSTPIMSVVMVTHFHFVLSTLLFDRVIAWPPSLPDGLPPRSVIRSAIQMHCTPITT